MGKNHLKIAHVTPHVGGGVGTVIQNIFSKSCAWGLENSLFCLDKCNSNFTEISKVRIKRQAVFKDNFSELSRVFINFDIILLHYWNHPLMAAFLNTFSFPKSRVICWAHNSGLFEPHIIPLHLCEKASKIIFSSKCSLDSPNLSELIKKQPEKFDVVHSIRDLSNFLEIGKNRANNSKKKLERLLYVGTVSRAKLHHFAPQIFSDLSKSGFTINVLGGPEHDQLCREVSMLGGKINALGEVENVSNFYQQADIFIYPLNRHHYGTGEQVILEALAAGLPVVAFNNPAERAILERNCGLLVSDKTEFVKNTQKLASSMNLQQKLISNANRRLETTLNAKYIFKNLTSILENLMATEKNVSGYLSSNPLTEDILKLYAENSFFKPAELYQQMSTNNQTLCEAIKSKISNSISEPFQEQTWLDKTKSTPSHYVTYFPEYDNLRKLNNLLKMTFCKI